MLENAQKWIDISDEDLSMAEISFGHSRYLHMTFFCQQSIEKALKGLYFEKKQQTPPRKHDLLALSASCDLLDEMSLKQKTFLATVSIMRKEGVEWLLRHLLKISLWTVKRR